MMTLLTAEWYKLIRSKALALILAGAAITAGLSIQGNISREDMENLTGAGWEELSESGFLLGCTGVNLISMSSMFIILWIAAFIGFFTASEFQNGTIRNVLALGKSRSHVFFSKFLISCAAVAAILVVVGSIGTIGATLAFGFGGADFPQYARYLSVYLPMQLYLHMIFAAIFCAIAFISRSVGMTLLLSIAYLVVTLTFTAYVGQFENLAFIQHFFPYGYVHYMTEYALEPWHFIPRALLTGAVHMLIPCAIGCFAFQKADIT